MLIISSKEQKQLIQMSEVIEQVEKALKEFAANRTVTPIRLALPFYNNENTGLTMPSVAEDLNTIGVKIVMVAPNNQKIGKKTINGVVLLSDFETGEPVAMLEGSYLTMMRTGALSGVATKYLAKQKAKTLCIIGTGEQAHGLLEAILTVREIDIIYLYNRTHKKAEQFAEFIKETYQKNVVVCQDVNDAVKSAEIIVTTTNAKTPVFSSELNPGTHINAVGSFRPNMQEVPTNAIISANKIVVEDRIAALEETGDFIVPIKEGVFSEDGIYDELGKIVMREVNGRETEDEITIFKSVGLAVVDVVVAQYIYEKALKLGVGVNVTL